MILFRKSLVWVTALLLCCATTTFALELEECTRSRPGWGDHRTLFVPQWMMENGDPSTNEAWAAALCCVYTYVQVVATTSSSKQSSAAILELYDGSEYTIRRSTAFEQIASDAYADICDMEMGRVDCERQAACVEQAFTAEPNEPQQEEEYTITAATTTREPTQEPTTETPTASPTSEAPSANNNDTSSAWFHQLERALNCSTDRPGWAEHRTLFVPDSMLILPNNSSSKTTTTTTTNTSISTELFDAQIVWLEALCCVYTYVEFTSSTSMTAQLQVYDGYVYNIPVVGGDDSNSFLELAQTAMDDICGMSMGSRDCELQNECVQAAFDSTTMTGSND